MKKSIIFSLCLLSFSSLAHAGKDFQKTPRDAYGLSDGVGYTAQKVKIAILDQPANFENPSLKGKIVRGYDAINDREYTVESYQGSFSSHGTNVAQIIAEIAPDAEIIPVIISTNTEESFERAFKYVSEISPHVVNMSYEFTGANMERILPYRYEMVKNQTVFMKSADNRGSSISRTEDEILKPYQCSVGALNIFGQRMEKNHSFPNGASFQPGSSNFPAPDFNGNFMWAKGHHILLNQSDGREEIFHQTSAATPFMTAAYGLLVEAWPEGDAATRLKFLLDASKLATYENQLAYHSTFPFDEGQRIRFAKGDMRTHPRLDIKKPLLEYLPQEKETPGWVVKQLENLN